MDVREFVTKIQRLHPMQSVTLRFAEDGMTGLMRLHDLLTSDSRVCLGDSGDIVMAAVLMSRDWGGSHNRSYTVYGLSQANDQRLCKIGQGVESIEISDHGAKGIASGRQKVRNETAGKLIDSVLTDKFVEELWEWKIDIEGYLEEFQELPAVWFRMAYQHVTIGLVGVDGWSGRIIINNQFSDLNYTTPEQIQEVIRDRMEAVIEELTAA